MVTGMGELEYRSEFASAEFSERPGGDGAQGAGRGGSAPPAGASAGAGGAQDAGFADKRSRVRVHIGSSASTFVVNVTGASGADMRGSIMHLYSRSEYRFRTIFEFVATLQGISDTYDYPQKGYRLRTWDEAAGGPATAGGMAAGSVAAMGGSPAPERLAHGMGFAPGGAGGSGAPAGGGQLDDDIGGEKLRLSFVIRLQYRQNASWQGEVQWTDCKSGSATVQFRSLLELLALMSEARALSRQG
jgi:hypothetical protein